MNDISELVGEWYTSVYKEKSGSRFKTFELSLKLLYNNTSNPLIVETGTVRQKDDFGAGYSTVIFGECVSKFGGNLITIDNNKNHMILSRDVTKEWANKITYINDDSIKTLSEFKQKIDLIYLDSYDCPIEGDATDAQIHNLNEFKEVENLLTDASIILIDDVSLGNGGKAKLTHEYLLSKNYKCIEMIQQSVWTK